MSYDPDAHRFQSPCSTAIRNKFEENLIISRLSRDDPALEIVERKGLGHPDTICDALAKSFSRNLCRAYLDRFGEIAHHNVDKALLCAGRAAPAFGGDDVLAPIRIYLAGRAVGNIGGSGIPVSDIAMKARVPGCAPTCTRWTWSVTFA